MARILLVSNRLPITIRTDGQGQVGLQRSAGGLATGLSGPHRDSEGLWIGWPGDTSELAPEQLDELAGELARQRLVAVALSAEEIASYYDGFCNGVVWPLFHHLIDRIPLHARGWESYRQVNERFASAVLERYRPGDRIWIHDYQLGLVPALVRAQLPEATIGFFLHIPFPAPEIYRIFPWREELLEGLLGADLVGFHTLSYARHFANALLHVLGLLPNVDRVTWRGRVVRFGAYPMGIDVQSFTEAARAPAAEAAVQRHRTDVGDRALLLGIDRLDYTKGIPRRLRAVERLLEKEPSWRGRLRLLQVAVPSRVHVDEYVGFHRDVNELVGRINGAYGTPSQMPVHYVYRSFSQTELVHMYRAADVMLVTPLRDGMNLVAKEFVASRVDDGGVLVLSEFAGAAAEMGEAVLVNPYDIEGMADGIARALSMPLEERGTRMRALRERVLGNDVHRWVAAFLGDLDLAREGAAASAERMSSSARLSEVVGRIQAADELLWLLDYDGTLVPFASRPELAQPDPDLRRLLLAVTTDPRHHVHVLSGRPRDVLERWLGALPVGLHAEHGLWSRAPGSAWEIARDLPNHWKQGVREILAAFAARVPGSLVEEKTCGLAWHYRMADPEFGEMQAKELQIHLAHTLSNEPVEILPGAKVVEVRPHGIDKGSVATRLLARLPRALPIVCGDDETDESMFAAIPEHGIAVHVGARPSRAAIRVADYGTVRWLLRQALERQ